jgi:four helix bundle protein
VSNDARRKPSDDHLRSKSKALAIEVLRLVDVLSPRDITTQVMVRQLVRSATSVGANYRAATRARSQREAYAKLSIVEEEADEVGYWLERLEESGRLTGGEAHLARVLSNEVVAMTVASKKTLARQLASTPRAKSGRDDSTLDTRGSTLAQRTAGDGR